MDFFFGKRYAALIRWGTGGKDTVCIFRSARLRKVKPSLLGLLNFNFILNLRKNSSFPRYVFSCIQADYGLNVIFEEVQLAVIEVSTQNECNFLKKSVKKIVRFFDLNRLILLKPYTSQ